MNILILAPYISTNGLGKVAANLSEIFNDKGYDVTIAARFKTDNEFHHAGTVRYTVDTKEKDDFFSYFSFVKDMSKLSTYDICLSIGPSYDFINAFLMSSKSKVITTIHNNIDISYSLLYKKLLPYIARKSDFIAPVSSSLTTMLKTYINPIDFHKVVHVNNPVNIDVVDDYSEFENYYVCVGRLAEQKAFWHAISAIKLSRTNSKLLILGNGENEKYLKKMVNDLNLTEQVIFLGHVSNSYAVIKNAKALLMTSLFEGLPMVLIESLMVFTPVISVDCISGPKEIIEYGSDKSKFPGFLLKNKAVPKSKYEPLHSELDRELARSIDYFDTLSNEEIIMLQDNCKRAAKRFSFENIGSDWDKFFTIKS